MTHTITIALAGNPNSGKTTIFNNLTGARQHVGNYPGVTVEKKVGQSKHKGIEINVIDLPGTYSLTAYSMEEVVARNFIIDEKPDVVVDILDATNVERNLYLATQLMELGVPLILVLNMMDVAKARGIEFDIEKLSRLLGEPIVPSVGHKNQGTEKLLDMITSIAAGDNGYGNVTVNYGREVEEELAKIKLLIAEEKTLSRKYPPRWLSVKLMENDRDAREKVLSSKILQAVEKSTSHIEKVYGDHPEIIIADRRYGFISGACQEAIRSTVESRHDWSDRIDEVVTSRILGLPIFLGLMYLVFHLTFTLGTPLMEWVETGFGLLGGAIESLWPEGSGSALKSLLVDGVIGGVGGVVVFLPNILLMFIAIAVLEDSGYMARAAFIMDRLMHRIGLHGKSFIPMLIGFGCSVPAIMATRTLENRRDRFTTMLVLPLISCGARLPIYMLIIPAFFPESLHTPMLWIIYLIGIILAIVSAKLLRSTLFKGASAPFVMELPPYRVPTIKGVLIHMWERGWLYLKKAGTIILGVSIVLWAMTSYPKVDEVELQGLPEEEALQVELSHSIAGRIGHALEPLLKPMGFDWRIGTALIGAFAAKEVFVAQLGIVYSLGEVDEESEGLRKRLQENYIPLVGFCIMLFTLISAPCMATIAVTRRESGKWRWALLQLGGLTAMAYLLTLIVYQVGSSLQIGIGA
jgi:ferrous iron transport protein B